MYFERHTNSKASSTDQGIGAVQLGHNYVATRLSNHSIALSNHPGAPLLVFLEAQINVTLNVATFGGLFELFWSRTSSIWIQTPRLLADIRYTNVAPVVEVSPKNSLAAKAVGSSLMSYPCGVHDGELGCSVQLCTASGASMTAGTEWNARVQLRY